MFLVLKVTDHLFGITNHNIRVALGYALTFFLSYCTGPLSWQAHVLFKILVAIFVGLALFLITHCIFH